MKEVSIDNLEEKIVQQTEDSIKQSEQTSESEELFDQEYAYMPKALRFKYNVFAIILKIISSIVLLAGVSFGLSIILTSSNSKIAFASILTGTWIIVGSTVFFLLFYGLGEIISILHDIRNEQ